MGKKPRRTRHPISGKLVEKITADTHDEREAALLADRNALDRAYRVLAAFSGGLSIERICALHKCGPDDARFMVDVALRASVTRRARPETKA